MYLLVEDGLTALVLGEIGIRSWRREFERPIVGTAEETHDSIDPAQLFEIQSRQVHEGITNQEREPLLEICFVR
ncbi:hypothetical protein FB008_11555 [Sinorhizobium medicae]|nr:hypothetical protein FB008_11555 [Sinorhizobium medicae]